MADHFEGKIFKFDRLAYLEKRDKVLTELGAWLKERERYFLEEAKMYGSIGDTGAEQFNHGQARGYEKTAEKIKALSK